MTDFGMNKGVIVVLVCMAIQACSSKSTDFVLLGCNGDLARRYLYQSLYDISARDGHQNLRVHAGARSPTLDLDSILKKSLKQRIDTKFRANISYRQLKHDKHYESLCKSISPSTDVIIFYLAIPPFAFPDTIRMITKGCNTFLKAGKLRVIIEKPFGSDLDSAEKMSKNITAYLPDEYAYRIDHYLGKEIVREILPFRQENSGFGEFNSLLSYHSVASIEVAMLEKIDCKGRSEYFDSYGVVRDVMQNHLTEMLLLVTSSLPNNISDTVAVSSSRLAVLDAGLADSRSLSGQYFSYLSEIAAETKGRITSSETPTFAAVSLLLNAADWWRVPVLLVAGKKMATKASYVRVLLKRRDAFSTASDRSFHVPAAQEVLFYVGGDLSSRGLVLCSRGVRCRPTRRLRRVSVPPDAAHILTGRVDDYEAFEPLSVSSSAYTRLLGDAMSGRRSSFVSERHLLASWRWWDAIVRGEGKGMRRYRSWAEVAVSATGGSVEWSAAAVGEEAAASLLPWATGGVETANKTMTASLDKISRFLALHIANMSSAVAQSGKHFHVALPGGRSPLRLFAYLRSLPVPWSRVHVWLTDERCVPRDSPHANANLLHAQLLSHTPIPLQNQHRVFLPTTNDSCHTGAKLYAREVDETLGRKGLDLVVLGVGEDGHVASLFPGDPVLASNQSVGESRGGRRVTLSLKTIMESREVAMIFTGRGKEVVLREMRGGGREGKPFLRILRHSNVKIFVDEELVKN